MKELLQNVFDAGLGVAALTKEKIEALQKELVEKGRMTREEGLLWLAEHREGNRALFVGETGGAAAGYVSLSRFSPKGGYDRTLELSVYVARRMRGQGVGGRLMEHIVRHAKADPSVHALVSVITSSNTASRNLHEKFGFRHAGTLKEAGWKFGIALDADYYELLV